MEILLLPQTTFWTWNEHQKVNQMRRCRVDEAIGD